MTSRLIRSSSIAYNNNKKKILLRRKKNVLSFKKSHLWQFCFFRWAIIILIRTESVNALVYYFAFNWFFFHYLAKIIYSNGCVKWFRSRQNPSCSAKFHDSWRMFTWNWTGNTCKKISPIIFLKYMYVWLKEKIRYRSRSFWRGIWLWQKWNICIELFVVYFCKISGIYK